MALFEKLDGIHDYLPALSSCERSSSAPLGECPAGHRPYRGGNPKVKSPPTLVTHDITPGADVQLVVVHPHLSHIL